MIGFGQFERKGFRKLAAVVGVLLIATFAMIQAIHVHPELGLAENSHCAICAVAHATPAVVTPVAVPVLVFIQIRLVLFEPLLRSSGTLSPLYSRPPPPMA
jgi:hypothetical protein